MSAYGTKRTCRTLLADVGFRGQTGHRSGHGFMSTLDPKRTLGLGRSTLVSGQFRSAPRTCRPDISESARALLERESVPAEVKLAFSCLSQCHSKLFVVVGEPSAALGADHGPGLHQSDLLCEFVKAMRSRERPKVLVRIHDITRKSMSFEGPL